MHAWKTWKNCSCVPPSLSILQACPFFPVDSAGDLIPTESGSAQLVRSRDVCDVLLPGPSVWSFVTYHSVHRPLAITQSSLDEDTFRSVLH